MNCPKGTFGKNVWYKGSDCWYCICSSMTNASTWMTFVFQLNLQKHEEKEPVSCILCHWTKISILNLWNSPYVKRFLQNPADLGQKLIYKYCSSWCVTTSSQRSFFPLTGSWPGDFCSGYPEVHACRASTCLLSSCLVA